MFDGSEPVKISSSPWSVQNTHLSSMPSPASIDQVAPHNSFPPLVAAPDSGINASTPPTALSGRYQAFMLSCWMKNQRLRYFQTWTNPLPCTWPGSNGVGQVIADAPSASGAPSVP